jgi:O-antigen/teichoic acid export membrane protein
LLKRILAVFGAGAFSQVTNIVLRLVGVSVFLQYWGEQQYGEWLILLTIPSYLALSGTGISNVAANDMSIKSAQGKTGELLSVFQSIWAFVSCISLLFFCICVALSFLFPLQSWLGLELTTSEDVSIAAILLGMYACSFLQCELLLGVYRACNLYARGILFCNLIMVFENCIVLISVLFSRDILFAISLYTGLRLLGTTLMAFHIKKKAPWFVYGFRHVRISIIKKSVLPSISLILIHISNALTVQGIVTLIGIRLGASAVVSFSVIRTVINLVKQFNSMIYYSILPEFSTSIATGDLGTTKKLHRMACQSSLYFTVFNIVLLLFFGEPVIRIWTNGNFEPDFAFMALMLISILSYTFYFCFYYLNFFI